MSRKAIPIEKRQIAVAFKLPKELLDEIDQYLKEHPREGNRSEFIRHAVKTYIKKPNSHP